jgi:hypothetical protein
MLLAHRKQRLPALRLRTQLQAAVVADLAVAAAAVDMKAVVVVVDIKVVTAAAVVGTNP